MIEAHAELLMSKIADQMGIAPGNSYAMALKGGTRRIKSHIETYFKDLKCTVTEKEIGSNCLPFIEVSVEYGKSIVIVVTVNDSFIPYYLESDGETFVTYTWKDETRLVGGYTCNLHQIEWHRLLPDSFACLIIQARSNLLLTEDHCWKAFSVMQSLGSVL